MANGCRSAGPRRHRRVLLCVLLLLCVPLRPAAFEFSARSVGYVAVFGPATYEQAAAGCASRQVGRQPAALVPASFLAHMLAALRAEAPSTLDALLGNLTAAAATSTQEQDGWSVWTWDEYRVCSAARLPAASTTAVLTISSTDRPCSWRLSYICVEQAFLAVQGLTSSTTWYRSYLQDASAAARRPTVGLDSGDVRFISSDLVLGNLEPLPTLDDPVTVLDAGWSWGPGSSITYRPFNDSDAFWSRGPVVSAFYRGGNQKLLALRLLRESDVDASWSMYADGSLLQTSELVGTTASGPYEAPVYEMYNVGANYSDYIVAVQGCYRSHLVERLLFVTRSGRQYQLGRGFCTNRFREDAPPGGYLAGIAGWHMNTTFWDPRNPVTTPPPPDLAYIDQLRIVWAALPGAGVPTYTVSLPPTVDDPWYFFSMPVRQSRFCPQARGLAYTFWLTRPISNGQCGMGADSRPVCPSNSCCGLQATISSIRRIVPTCGSTPEACRASSSPQNGCDGRFGLCGTAPERQYTQFVRSPPGREGTNETTIFLLRKDTTFTYSSAVDSCRSNTFLGFSWSLISAKDALDWTTSLDMRQGAFEAITTYGSFWVATSGNDTAPPSNSACVRVAYGGQPDANPSEAFAYTFAVSPCSSRATVICKASQAGQSLLGDATGASLRWAPGPHVLSLSPRRYGGGPYGASCGFALGAISGSNNSIGNWTVLVSEPVTQIAVSMATHPYNESDEVTTISGVRLRLGSGAVAEAGDESSYGWHTLDLAVGETITAVSGCWGGFVERLVLHTSAGRLWTPPFWASSSCSVPFTEVAPAGGYLVGLQGFIGYFMEGLQIVWGKPLSPVPRASPDPTSVVPGASADSPIIPVPPSPPAQQRPTDTSVMVDEGLTRSSGGGSSRVAIVGVAVGVASAVALAVAACLLLVWLRHHPPRVSMPAKEHEKFDGTGIVVIKQVSATGPATTGTLTPLDMSAEPEGGGLAAIKSYPPHLSYIVDVEDRLGAYLSTLLHRGRALMKGVQAGDGLTSSSSVWHRSGVDSSLSSLGSEPPQLDIVTAISRLHAELSGRQEQLQISSVLGKGSFGVVYLGTWRGLRVAVKTLVVHDALLGKEGRQRHRAILEAAISKSLQHPHVVTTYAAELVPLTAASQRTVNAAVTPTANSKPSEGSWEGSSVSQPSSMPDVYKLFIIQELCDVGSLTAALAAGAVGSVAAGSAAALCALTLALDIACGMCHIHAKSIVHGDLSSSNVLLASCRRTPAGQPEPLADPASEDMTLRRPLDTVWRPPVVAKVADFGLSVHMGHDQTHASNRFQGTPAYAAPEVTQHGRLSKAADVWAYGVILLELCHGQDIAQIRARAVPAPGAPPTRGAPAAQDAPPAPAPGAPAWSAPPADCPPALATLVASCLALDAAARPAFPQVVQQLVGLLRECHNTYWEAPAVTSTAAEYVTLTLC